MTDEKALVCDDCGKSGDDVRKTTCPYASDIHNEEIACTLCSDCEHERAMDI